VVKNLPLILTAVVVAGLVTLLVVFGERALSPESKYIHTISDQVQTITESLKTTNGLIDNREPSNPAWRGKLETEMEVWRRTYKEAVSAIPPSRYQQVHEKWIGALSQLDNTTTAIVSCLNDPPNTSSCEEVTSKLTQVAKQLEEMHGEIEKVD
jgi:hypothetical protein